MPKNGKDAEPGFCPHPFTGSGAMAMAPVSVCHHVSTMGHWPPPTTCFVHHMTCGDGIEIGIQSA